MEQTLHVVVKKARTVFQNPAKVKSYVTVKVGDELTKSPYIIGKDPVWHKTFTFHVPDISQNLEIKFMQDGFIFDTLLGIIDVPLMEVQFSNNVGTGRWLPLLIQNENVLIESGHELLLDTRFELPGELSHEEQEELANKLCKLNQILQTEVETLSSQRDKIRSEGFQIEKGSISSSNRADSQSVSIVMDSSLGDDEPFITAQRENSLNALNESNHSTPVPSITVSPSESPTTRRSISEENRKRIISQFDDMTNEDNDNDSEHNAQNSDPEADKDLKQEGHDIGVKRLVRNRQSSITARQNWRKALDDIKVAKKSGSWNMVANVNDEYTARERVKSILQSNLTSVQTKNMRPKSTGDAFMSSHIEQINMEEDGEIKGRSSSSGEIPEEKGEVKRFTRKYGFRHSPRASRRRQS